MPPTNLIIFAEESIAMTKKSKPSTVQKTPAAKKALTRKAMSKKAGTRKPGVRKRRKKVVKVSVWLVAAIAVSAALIVILLSQHFSFNKEYGAKVPQGDWRYGIDISHNNEGPIIWDSLFVMTDRRWRTVKDPYRAMNIKPVSFVYIKATEGATFKDCDFKTNWGDFSVSLINKNRADRYTPYASNIDLTDGLDDETEAYTNACKAKRLGAYKVRVAAGTYDVCAGYNDYTSRDYNKAEVDLYKQSFTADNSSFDITLPLYKVTLAGDAIKGINPGFYNWSIDKGEKITTYADINDKGEYEGNYNRIAYLKAGSYTLTGKGTVSPESSPAWDNDRTDWFNGYTANKVSTETKSYMQATVNVAISNANVSVAVPEGSKYKNDETTTYVNDTESYVGVKNKAALTPAVLDQATTIDYSEEYCYTFTPKTAGKYTLTTTNDLSIFDATGKKVEDTEGVYTLAAGTTYYIARGEKVDSDTDNDTFTISAVITG